MARIDEMSPNTGRILKEDGTTVNIVDDGITARDDFAACTRQGHGYFVTWSKTGLADAASTILQVSTHATKGMHLVGLQVIAGGIGALEIKENVTLNATPGGTACTPVNRNRNSANTSSQTCRGDPTIDSTVGSISLATFTVAAGNNFFDYGPLATELMLKDSEDYAIYMTNGSGAPANFVVIAQFYEDAT